MSKYPLKLGTSEDKLSSDKEILWKFYTFSTLKDPRC